MLEEKDSDSDVSNSRGAESKVYEYVYKCFSTVRSIFWLRCVPRTQTGPRTEGQKTSYIVHLWGSQLWEISISRKWHQAMKWFLPITESWKKPSCLTAYSQRSSMLRANIILLLLSLWNVIIWKILSLSNMSFLLWTSFFLQQNIYDKDSFQKRKVM